MATPTVQMNLRLDPDLVDELKLIAARRGLTLAALVAQTLGRVVQRDKKARGKTDE